MQVSLWPETITSLLQQGIWQMAQRTGFQGCQSRSMSLHLTLNKWQLHHAIYPCGWSAHCLQQLISSWPIQTTTQHSIQMRQLWTCWLLPWLQCILQLSQAQAIYISRTLYGVSVGSIWLVRLQFEQDTSAFWLLTSSGIGYWVCSSKTSPIPSNYRRYPLRISNLLPRPVPSCISLLQIYQQLEPIKLQSTYCAISEEQPISVLLSMEIVGSKLFKVMQMRIGEEIWTPDGQQLATSSSSMEEQLRGSLAASLMWLLQQQKRNTWPQLMQLNKCHGIILEFTYLCQHSLIYHQVPSIETPA